MFLRLNNLSWKQWIFYNVVEKSIYISNLDKRFVTFSYFVIKFISIFSRSFIMKNIITLFPPSQILQAATLFVKIRNLLTR